MQMKQGAMGDKLLFADRESSTFLCEKDQNSWE
jgi:hypothetical protein